MRTGTLTQWKAVGRNVYAGDKHVATMRKSETGWLCNQPCPTEEEAMGHAELIARAVNGYRPLLAFAQFVASANYSSPKWLADKAKEAIDKAGSL